MALGHLLRGLLSRPGQAAKPASPPAEIASESHAAFLLQAQSSEQRGDWSTAMQLYERVLEIVPDLAEAHRGLARVQVVTGRDLDAVDSYRMCLHYDPSDLSAAIELNGLLVRGGLLSDAIECLQEAALRNPASAQLQGELGLRLTQAERVAEARAALDLSIRLDAKYAPGWHNRGYLKLLIDDPEGALADFQTAARLNPAELESQAGIAHALRDMGQIDQAIAHYRKLLEQRADLDDVRTNLGLAELLLGRYEAGFADYEWRFGPIDKIPRDFPYRRWQGESLAGKTILVYAEQGIGDEMLFASCLPDVMRQAGRCIIECSDRLASLYARSFPDALVHGGRKTDGRQWLADMPVPDYQVPVGSLPRWLRRSPSDFPRHGGYLRPDDARIRRWRARLDGLPGRLRIGISWRGGAFQSRTLRRSIPWPMFARLLALSDVSFISLQHGEPGDEQACAEFAAKVHRFDGVTHDIDDLAALIDALDLVVTVSNTNGHIAGAIGAPVWILTPYIPDGRYGLDPRRMPWYPSARLYRQDPDRRWAPVVEAVESDLAAWVRAGR